MVDPGNAGAGNAVYKVMDEITAKPTFSASEERLFKQCRLAHHFQYDLGYRRQLPGRALVVGIAYHEGLEFAYKNDFDREATLAHVGAKADARWAELLEATPNMAGYTESLATFQKDKELVEAMVDGYLTWRKAADIDEGFTTVEVEAFHLIDIPGAVATMPVRMDLVQRNDRTGKLRVVDFKTARNIPNDMTGYQISEQNGNYQLACLAIYDERPTELAYRFARKVIPSGRSKPPYFKEQVIRLTPDELRYRVEEFKTVAAARYADDRAIYAEPDNCCGSWRNDWTKPCKLVHMGMDPSEALEQSPGYGPYERKTINDEEDE